MSENPTLPATTDRQFENLTEKQEAFVHAYVASGGKLTASAKSAGYAPKSAHVEAHRLMQKPEVIRAIYECTALALGSHVPAALAKLAKLSDRAKSEYVQLEASKDLLDRAGLSAPKKVTLGGGLNVTFDLS